VTSMPSPVTLHERAPVGIVLQFWLLAAILRPLKHLVPLKLLVRLVRSRRQPPERRRAREDAILGYMSARDRFPWRAPANCLERSLAAYRLLGAVGARPELHVGVRRNGAPGAVDGHVWVVVDRRPVAEAPEFIDRFTPVLRVDAGGRVAAFGASSSPAPQARQARSGS
jgi:hypothetical protein